MSASRVILLCLVVCLGPARSVSAQVSVEIGGGIRLPAGWLINGDVALPNGLFVGADVMFVTGSSDAFSAYSLQAGYRFGSAATRGFQPYVVGSYGVNRDSTGDYHLFGLGGGVRYWPVPRVAPFVEYRQYIGEVNAVGRAPGLSNYTSAGTVAFGITFRPVVGRTN